MILKLVDAHAHLDSQELVRFISTHNQENLSVISNSVNVESSTRNLELSRKLSSVVAFVGIHPEVFRYAQVSPSIEELDSMVEKIAALLKFAKGIGEVGLDPSYGRIDSQKHLLSRMLEIVEKTKLPVTIHSRGATAEIIEILTTYNLKSRILFHWFAGTEKELYKLHASGIYTSFGPSIIFSKRISTLLQLSDRKFILAETDSPTRFRSVMDAPSNPTLISSVVFHIGLLLNLPFEDACELTSSNSKSYLSTQD